MGDCQISGARFRNTPNGGIISHAGAGQSQKSANILDIGLIKYAYHKNGLMV